MKIGDLFHIKSGSLFYDGRTGHLAAISSSVEPPKNYDDAYERVFSPDFADFQQAKEGYNPAAIAAAHKEHRNRWGWLISWGGSPQLLSEEHHEGRTNSDTWKVWKEGEVFGVVKGIDRNSVSVLPVGASLPSFSILRRMVLCRGRHRDLRSVSADPAEVFRFSQ